MLTRTILIGALLSWSACCLQAAEPTRIIFDTDLGNDIDDALALAMLHALSSRNEVQLLAVTTTKDHPLVGPAVDAVNTFYGRPEIPVGVVKGGKTPEASPMLPALTAAAYPHRLRDGREAPDAVAVLRRTLAAQPDGSVTIVQVGFSTNLARLLESDRGLAARKVRLLVVMAGNFNGGPPEYNVKMDIPAARRVFQDWPTPVVFSGFEIGKDILYRASTIEHAFSYVPHHPIADAYRAYMKMPYDRPTWDLTAVLYAARPGDGYFSLSKPGKVLVDDKGATRFDASPEGTRRYLIATPEQRIRVLEVLEGLSSEPPSVCRAR
jgi:inosine-uridine nucleoside N-ribohydrolase